MSDDVMDEYNELEPLLVAMIADIEEVCSETPSAVYFQGKSMVYNRFLCRVRKFLNDENLPLICENGAQPVEVVREIFGRYGDALADWLRLYHE